MYGRITFKAFYNTRCVDSFHDCSVHLEEVLCFAAFSHLQDFFSLGGGISKTILLFWGPNWSQLVIMALKNTQKHKKRCFLHKRTVDIFWPNKAYHRGAHAQSYVSQKKVSHILNAHRMETWQTECMYTTTVLLKHKWIHESSSKHFFVPHCPTVIQILGTYSSFGFPPFTIHHSFHFKTQTSAFRCEKRQNSTL